MHDNLTKYIVAVIKRSPLNEFWALLNEAHQLVNQAKFEEAQDKYNKLKAAYDNIKALTPFGSSTELYESAIADLEKSISQAQIK